MTELGEKCESDNALPMLRARAIGRGGYARYNIFIITASVMSLLSIVFNLYKLPRYKEAQDNLLGTTFDGGTTCSSFAFESLPRRTAS